jgi:uncharacterized protein YhaN
MRLTRLHIERYGNLENTRLALDPAPGVVNLVVAPNGTGKSVLRQAFSDLLFGVPGQTPMGFRYGYPAMRLRAEALGPDGPVAFGRRKGLGNTLVGADDAPLPPALLDRLLGGVDRAGLERLFALDTAGLRRGGRQLLETGGALADALLSGAGGMRSATDLRAALLHERDEQAPERKTASRPFYQALQGWTDARKRLRDDTLRPEDRARREAELATARQALHAANAAEVQAATELTKLERIRRTRPLLAQLAAAQGWLAAHPDAPVLPDGLAGHLAAAVAEAQQTTLLQADLRRRQADAGQRAAADPPDERMLAHAALVEHLEREAGVAAQAALDLPGCLAELDRLDAAAAATLRELGAPAGNDAAALVPPGLARTAARRLIARHRDAVGPLAALPAGIAALEQQVAVPLPPVVDAAPLAALVLEVRADGAPGPRLADAALAAETARAAAMQAAAHAPPGLSGPAPQPLDVFDALDAALRSADQAMREAATRLAAAVDAAAARARDVAGLDPDLPDATAVADARRHRDAGWHLVFRRAFTDDPPDPDALAAWAGPVPLPLAYEQATAAADAAADRRVRDAGQVERAALLRQALATSDAELAQARQAEAAAYAAQAAAREDWAAAVQPLGLPGTARMGAVRDVLARRAEALAAERAAAVAAAAHAGLLARHLAWSSQVAALLDQPDAPLPALLRAADLALHAAAQAGQARAVAEAGQRRAQEQLATARAERARLDAELDAWRMEWTAAMAALGRPLEEAPETANDALQLLDRLEGEARRAADMRQRVDDMQARIGSFAKEAAAAALLLAPGLVAPNLVAPDLDGAPPQDAVRALRGRLDAAAKAAAVRDDQRRTLLKLDEECAAAARAEAAATLALQAVLAAAGAGDPAEAEARILLSSQRAAQAALRDRLAAEMLAASDGLPAEQVRAEADAADPDGLPAATAQARRDQEAAGARAQAAAAAATRLADELQQDAGTAAAVQAAHDEAASAARLGRVLEDALLAHAAAALLAAGLAAVEAQGDTPLVARIGAAFQALTAGAYTGVALRPDDKGEPRLAALERAHPAEPRAITELSEGTQDQLFLALRLVSIEDHVAARPSLPFLGDDILQSFDDARAAAVLRSLVALSRHTQVVLLTHHEHLLGLAGALRPGSVHVQRMTCQG